MELKKEKIKTPDKLTLEEISKRLIEIYYQLGILRGLIDKHDENEVIH